MPLKRCEVEGQLGWQWGDAGKCYVYTADDEESEAAARKKAMAQAAAMGEFPGTGNRSADPALASEIQHRNSTLHDVDKKQRIVDIIAVPWDEESDKVFWRGEMWSERFDRHAFDGIENHAGRIMVNREHVKGDTVGRVIHADPTHKDGLFARVKMYSTPRGEETLTLADEGGAFPSVGYYVKSFAHMELNKRSKTRRILKAFWDHLAFVEDPAFDGVGVLAVRAGQSGLTVVEQRPLLETPALDEAMSDDVLAWAASRLKPSS
jgi:hypothetical protein